MNSKINPITSFKCELGEGLIWDDNTERLLMTDILSGKLIELDILSNTSRYWQLNEPIAWVLPTTLEKKYLIGLKSGLALFDINNPEKVQKINSDFPGKNDCRLNDACIDSGGRVWLGSMNMLNPSSKDGQLASFSAKSGLKIHDFGFTVTNGPLISPDGKFLFLNDTLQGKVYRYQLNLDSGKLNDRQLFKTFSPDQGYPDGMCFDSEGNLWIALWGGASIVQLDSTGDLLKKISIPALNVSNICFCGPTLDRLIVSTALTGLRTEDFERFPNSGSLFEISDHETSGVSPYRACLGF